MIRTFTYPTTAAVTRALKGERRDTYVLGTSTEFAALALEHKARGERASSWTGGHNVESAARAAVEGDMSAAAASDSLLATLEAMFPAPTAARRYVDDVAGAVPNVQAFIAGTPLTMRRRTKVENEFAPLAIVVDVVGSAAIDAGDMAKRGAAILALVRALAARRPVELWAGCSLAADGPRNAVHMYFRIDTAPLDLARAAFLLTSPAVSRSMGFAIGYGAHGFTGKWPYDNVDASRANFHGTMARAFPHVTDVLTIPGAFVNDPAVTRPVEWIADFVKQYGEAELELAAAA